MSAILQKMLLLMLMIAIGYIANKCGAMDADFTSRLSKFLLNVTVPAALLSAGMSGEVTFSPVQLLKLFLLSAALFAVEFGVGYVVPLLSRAKGPEAGTYRFLTAFPNSIFMGYPVATAFFGSSAVIYVAMLSMPFNIAVFSIGPAMLTGRVMKDFSWKSVINGGTVSSVAAMLLILFQVKVPPVISELCSSVGSATTPLALIVIGSNLAGMTLREIFGTANAAGNGEVFFRKYDRNPAVMHIVNKASSDAYVSLCDGLLGRSVLKFYVRAGEELTADTPVGYFEFHISTGAEWKNADELFGSGTVSFTDRSEHGQELGRKKTCEFVIEPGFANLDPAE